ncbi:MAG: putative lipid II flippase FtsW [Mycobacteriales bacterium]
MRRADALAARRYRPAFLDRPFASLHMLLATTALLATIGLVMVLSASSVDSYSATGSVFDVFKKQALWFVLGVPIFWLGVRLSPQTHRRLAVPVLCVAALGLIAVLVPGIGVVVAGGRRWIDLGPFQLQPSEPAKLALVLWGADLLTRRERMLADWRHMIFPLIPVAVVIAGLVMLEPDLGTTLCILLILFGLLWTVGAPARLFAGLAAATTVGVLALIVVEPYRAARLTGFLHSSQPAPGTWDQASQGLSALSSGGWFGVGLGQSRFKWGLLPNAHTDYIFAILGEELGLVGCVLVLGLFAVLAFSALRIAHRTADTFSRLVAGACAVWLTGQALINIGYVVGLLPVTGIPLPLISFGGTSLVMTLFVLGMLCSMARHEPAAITHTRSQGRGPIAKAFWLPVPARPRPLPRRKPKPAAAARRAGRANMPPRDRSRRDNQQGPVAPRRRTPPSRGRAQLRPSGTHGRR